MKKIAIMLLAALMLFAFVACNPDANDDTAADAAQVVADYIDALDKNQLMTDIASVTASTPVEGMTYEAAEENGYKITFTAEYANAAKENTLEELEIVGTVVLLPQDAEDATVAIDSATKYEITADVTLSAKDTDSVELEATATGNMDSTSHQPLVDEDTTVTFTTLKVGGTDVKETVDWEDIFKLTDNYVAPETN